MKYLIVALAYPFAAIVASMTCAYPTAAQVIGQDDPETKKPPAEWLKHNVIARFWWGAPKEANDAFTELNHRDTRDAYELMRYAGKPAKDAEQQQRRGLILDLLGQYGSAPGVIEFLIENVDVKAGDMSGTWWQSKDMADYACARSLVKIGQSSVPRILEHLATTRNAVGEKTIDLYAYVLLYVYIRPPIVGGHEEALGVVERAAARVPKERREHLDKLAAAIRRIVAKEPHWQASQKRAQEANQR